MNDAPREPAPIPVRESRPLLAAGSLSSIVSLIAIIGAIVSGAVKLNSIDNNSSTNCQLLAGGIVLTLETSKARTEDREAQAFLTEQSARFAEIAKGC